MQIRDMFAQDINRPINGVIKVDQDADSIIAQEVREYVVTHELKKHFAAFFSAYCHAFEVSTADIGVWISGFFGSGKSHFLKMLSYLLANKRVEDTTTAELFRPKLDDGSATYEAVMRAAHARTETILFNIDVFSAGTRDKNSVPNVFAKMFYNHLGYYGEDLKVVRLEQHIAAEGRTEEFRRVFAEKKGSAWEESRRAYAFHEKIIVETLMEVLGMSEEGARSWFRREREELSIDELVTDIRAYVEAQEADFRLLFMIDEVGQYVGTDRTMLLNLQSIVETVGARCMGKVWIMCTGQEALDEIIRVRTDEFSRIQARFSTRLSLSSSSVDEVIQKRLLEKNTDAAALLTAQYDGQYSAVLRNVFSFVDTPRDMRGYDDAEDYAANFPFVPYQFLLLQRAFAAIRKHGNAGQHHSGGERSMLSAFQETAQKLQERDAYALAPFFHFYDSVHGFLDSSIRQVIERGQQAAERGDGLLPADVNVLKLLYLIRYVADDMPASLENIVILMADDVRVDKIALRAEITRSLERLQGQNYIGRSGARYHFLTNEEQDIQRGINHTDVDTGMIQERIHQILFADLYAARKFRSGAYDFDFDAAVGRLGGGSGGLRLVILTAAEDPQLRMEQNVLLQSKGQAVLVLADAPYYENLENAMKIRQYVKQQNFAKLPKSVENIIKGYQNEALRCEAEARETLAAAVCGAAAYIDGEHVSLTGKDVKTRLDQALAQLVARVYHKLDLITKNIQGDDEIRALLDGTEQTLPGMAEANSDAARSVEEYLRLQEMAKRPTSMADVQSHYQEVPYGWREIDIAYAMAMLVKEQRVTVKYGGETIRAEHPRLIDFLRRKSETGKTRVTIRQSVDKTKMRQVRAILEEYFDAMNLPADEDGLMRYIVENFAAQRGHYGELARNYEQNAKYPGRTAVSAVLRQIEDVLAQKSDNNALIGHILVHKNDLLNAKEAAQQVEEFFARQSGIFDEAVRLEKKTRDELSYLTGEVEATAALNEIRKRITFTENFDYRGIPQLRALMATVSGAYDALLAAKRAEIGEVATDCLGAVHQDAADNPRARDYMRDADSFYTKKREEIAAFTSLVKLDGLSPQMYNKLEEIRKQIAALTTAKPSVTTQPSAVGTAQPAAPRPAPKNIKQYARQVLFPSETLASEADIDAYLSRIRKQLIMYMKGCDGIQLK
ncbi:BREX system P-loop protein BrxC [Selenomonas noxia]|jgi:hypothetical protein|uniref:BREX system P-loop protein BrxC n=1 Tax=Selenomonas noxia TaxID=135083 RepID=UPI002359499B|nr:BREX system P-loop protein BrxC [Selenomonas noxia]